MNNIVSSEKAFEVSLDKNKRIKNFNIFKIEEVVPPELKHLTRELEQLTYLKTIHKLTKQKPGSFVIAIDFYFTRSESKISFNVTINRMTILKSGDIFLEVVDSLYVFIATKKAYDENTSK